VKKLRIRRLKRSRLWVIIGLPSRHRKWAGPYDDHDEAKSDRNGMQEFFDDNPDLAVMDEPPVPLVRPGSTLDRLMEETRAAMAHLRPDSIEWFEQRMEYLLHLASQLNIPKGV
jgi:hypothetical protein